MELLTFIGIIILVIIVGITIWIFRKIFGRVDDPENKDIIINGLANYCEGYGLGLIDSKVANKDKWKIQMIPRDIDYVKAKNDKDFKIKNQPVIVRRELLVPFPLSNHRTIYLALPDRAEHLPDEFKRHPFSKYVMAYIEDRVAEKDEWMIKSTRELNLMKIMKKHEQGGIGIFEDFISERNALDKEINSKIRSPEKDEK